MPGVDHVQSLVHRSGSRADRRNLAGHGQGAGWANPSEERTSESSLNALRVKASSSTGSTRRASSTTGPCSDTAASSGSTTSSRTSFNPSAGSGRQDESNSRFHSEGRPICLGTASRYAILRADRALVATRWNTIQSAHAANTGTCRTSAGRAKERTKGGDQSIAQPQQCRAISTHGEGRQGWWLCVCSEPR